MAPHVNDQGRSNPSSTGLTRRRLAAGEVSGAPVPCVCSTGHRSRRRWALRVADATARPLVAVVGPGVAGVDGGELFCGRRSSAADENDDTVHGRING